MITRYKNHPSIKNIKRKCNSVRSLSFQLISANDVESNSRTGNNKAVVGEIPVHVLKESDFTFETSTNYINKSIESGCCFPCSLEVAIILLPSLNQTINLTR